MTAGTAIANGTAIPAVSRPRNRTVTMRIWSSGPMREPAEPAHMGDESTDDREQQRRDTDCHREPRQPQRRFKIGRRALAEAPGGEFEFDELPQQQARKTERQHVEDRGRQRPPARAEP